MTQQKDRKVSGLCPTDGVHCPFLAEGRGCFDPQRLSFAGKKEKGVTPPTDSKVY